MSTVFVLRLKDCSTHTPCSCSKRQWGANCNWVWHSVALFVTQPQTTQLLRPGSNMFYAHSGRIFTQHFVNPLESDLGGGILAMFGLFGNAWQKSDQLEGCCWPSWLTARPGHAAKRLVSFLLHPIQIPRSSTKGRFFMHFCQAWHMFAGKHHGWFFFSALSCAACRKGLAFFLQPLASHAEGTDGKASNMGFVFPAAFRHVKPLVHDIQWNRQDTHFCICWDDDVWINSSINCKSAFAIERHSAGRWQLPAMVPCCWEM